MSSTLSGYVTVATRSRSQSQAVNVGRSVLWIVRSLLGQNGRPVHSNVCQVSGKVLLYCLLSMAEPVRTSVLGVRRVTLLVKKINNLQFDDCVDTFAHTARGLNALHSV